MTRAIEDRNRRMLRARAAMDRAFAQDEALDFYVGKLVMVMNRAQPAAA